MLPMSVCADFIVNRYLLAAFEFEVAIQQIGQYNFKSAKVSYPLDSYEFLKGRAKTQETSANNVMI